MPVMVVLGSSAFGFSNYAKVSNFKSQMVSGCSKGFDARTKYIIELDFYFMQINKDKVKRYSWKFSRDRRLNFTIAHELAHIFLDHLVIPEDLKTPEQLIIEEEEANEFAGRLLMPADLLLKSNFVSHAKVAKHFNVSEQSLWKRLNHLKRLDLLSSPIFNVCEICSNRNISPGANYCPVCGEWINEKERGVMPMIYDDGYILNKINGKAKNCPNCDNEEMGDSGSWCRICSNIVVNKCTSQFCKTIAYGNSRYCEICGEKTTFFEAGYLLDWQEAKKRIEAQKDPFYNGAQIRLEDIDIDINIDNDVNHDEEIPF